MAVTVVKFDTDDLTRIIQILNRRAAFMVKDLTRLGRVAADDYYMARKAYKLKRPSQYVYLRRRGRRVRQPRFHATGNQQARGIEKMSYRAFQDFFGYW